MLLFESSLSSAFWNVLSYSVVQAYSVSDFEKCTTLFRYFSLLCYLELGSKQERVPNYGLIKYLQLCLNPICIRTSISTCGGITYATLEMRTEVGISGMDK